jgi:hypothetical protein
MMACANSYEEQATAMATFLRSCEAVILAPRDEYVDSQAIYMTDSVGTIWTLVGFVRLNLRFHYVDLYSLQSVLPSLTDRLD